MEERIKQGKIKIASQVTALSSTFIYFLNQRQQAVSSYVRVLTSLNPKNVLSRGYTLIWNADKKLITSPKNVVIGEELVTQFVQGSIISSVKSKK